MSKARPLRNAAVKPRAKVTKAPEHASTSRKPAAARPAVARARMVTAAAPATPAKPAVGPTVSMPEPVAPPPLPLPIASFTF